LYRSVISDNLGNDPSTDGANNWISLADAQYVVYNNQTSGLVAVTGQEAFDEIVALIDNLPSSVVYRGQLDVSGGDASLPGAPTNGDLYVIAVAGTITVSTAGGAPAPEMVDVGEQIIYNGDEDQWDLIAQVTQAASISYNNSSSGLPDSDVQGAIDTLDSRLDDAEIDIAENADDILDAEGRLDSVESTLSGLGTAAQEDVQSGPLDTTAGALMAVGAFGLGSTAGSDQPDWPNTSLDNIENVGAGIYRTVGSTTGTPDGSGSWNIYFSRRNSPDSTQLALKSTAAPDIWIRYANGGTETNPTWSDWEQVWTSDNLVKQTSDTDATAGRVMTVPAFGIGSVDNAFITDLSDETTPTGLYRTDATSFSAGSGTPNPTSRTFK